MRRGDLVTVSLRGEQGKPRPALVVQSDHFRGLASVTVLPLTSTLIDASLLRVAVEPTPENGLEKPSQVMIDKPQTPPRERVGSVIGHLDQGTMTTVSRSLASFLGLG